jgi:hypothetical protein
VKKNGSRQNIFTVKFNSMKTIICCMSLLACLAAGAQPVKKKVKQPVHTATRPQVNNTMNPNDSVTWVKQPVTSQPANASQQPNKTKLDDLKNPFDTGKVIQKQPSNFSWGASNPQNQRTRKTPATGQGWIDDSLLWIKNKQQPVQKNISGQAGKKRKGLPQKTRISDSLGVAPVRPAVPLKKQ